MRPGISIDQGQVPAVGPRLGAGIDVAVSCLQVWARADGQQWERLTHADALFLQNLLLDTKAEMKVGLAPTYPRSHFQRLFKEPLTARRWMKFLRWFSLNIERALEKLCDERGELPVYPGRMSSRRGGRPEYTQAMYFISFQKPAASPRIKSSRSSGLKSDVGKAEWTLVPPLPVAESNQAEAAAHSPPKLDSGIHGERAEGLAFHPTESQLTRAAVYALPDPVEATQERMGALVRLKRAALVKLEEQKLTCRFSVALYVFGLLWLRSESDIRLFVSELSRILDKASHVVDVVAVAFF